MRRLSLFLILLSLAIPTRATIAIAQHTNKDAGTVTSTTLAYASNVTTNNLLAVVTRTGGTTATITITDSCGNTWTNLTRQSVSGVGVSQVAWAVSNCSSADTITDSLSTSTTLRMAIYELSGTATSTPIDFESNAGTGTSSVAKSAAQTPSADNELVLSFAATASNNSCSAFTNYTMQDIVPANPNAKLCTATWIQTTATSADGNISIGNDQWTDGIVFIKPAGGAVPPPARHKIINVKGGPNEKLPCEELYGHCLTDTRYWVYR